MKLDMPGRIAKTYNLMGLAFIYRAVAGKRDAAV